jgi:hypothetical protein
MDTRVWMEIVKGGDHWEDLGVDGIILKSILGIYDEQ